MLAITRTDPINTDFFTATLELTNKSTLLGMRSPSQL
jgi:hypothetical protein